MLRCVICDRQFPSCENMVTVRELRLKENALPKSPRGKASAASKRAKAKQRTKSTSRTKLTKPTSTKVVTPKHAAKASTASAKQAVLAAAKALQAAIRGGQPADVEKLLARDF